MHVNTYIHWVLQKKNIDINKSLSTIAATPAPPRTHCWSTWSWETLLLKCLFFWRPTGVPNIELGDSWARISPENHVCVDVFSRIPSECRRRQVKLDGGAESMFVLEDVRANPKFWNSICILVDFFWWGADSDSIFWVLQVAVFVCIIKGRMNTHMFTQFAGRIYIFVYLPRI